MRYYHVLVLIGVLTAVASLALASPTLTCDVRVGVSGNASVTMLYRSDSGSVFHTLLPRFKQWNYSVRSGRLLKPPINELSGAYFYYNTTFKYEVGETGVFELSITFDFPFASLYAGDRGWFMTPLFGAPHGTSVEVVVTVEGLGSVTEVSLNGVPITYRREGDTVRVRFPASGSRGDRVTIDYKPSPRPAEKVFEEDVGGVTVRVRAAPQYGGLSRKIAGVVRRALPYLKEVFLFSPTEVEFIFFLPRRMEFGPLGYVIGEDINAGGVGPIYLNLALVRFKEGYMETTIVHELIHMALGSLRVPANRELRWFHEGVAQYASLKICTLINVNVWDIEESLNRSASRFHSGLTKPGFVQWWDPGDEGAYYAASYYIVSTLASRYGGLMFLWSVSEKLRERGGVSTNIRLVAVLSEAAGEDLTPLFSEWGFRVGYLDPLAAFAPVVAAVVLAAAVTLSLAVLLKRRGQRCPYCCAAVPSSCAVCPCCGYLLRLELEGKLHSSSWA